MNLNVSLVQLKPNPWRRDRLPTPVFLGFPGGSAGEESARNGGDLSLIPGLGRSLGEGNGNPLLFWHGEFHGQRSLTGNSPWGHKEADMTERLLLHHDLTGS